MLWDLCSLKDKPMGAVSVFTMRNYLHQPSVCFFCGVSFRFILDNAIYGVSVKLFSSVQILIFLACTAFHPLFYALWREGLGRKYFLHSVDTRFHEAHLQTKHHRRNNRGLVKVVPHRKSAYRAHWFFKKNVSHITFY